MKTPTLVNHPPDTSPPPGNLPVIAPIYQSVKYEFEIGGRHAAHAARRDARLFLHARQQPDHAPARAHAGAAAGPRRLPGDRLGRERHRADAASALTKQGDHILCFVETYGPTRNIIRRLLARFGVEHTMLSIEDMAGIENVLATRPTRLVIFESPTNPITKVADIERLVELAHRHGALAVMDNTFAGFHQHGEYDVDLFVHSLTKYASGTGDVMGGAVIARRELIDAHARRTSQCWARCSIRTPRSSCSADSRPTSCVIASRRAPPRPSPNTWPRIRP